MTPLVMLVEDEDLFREVAADALRSGIPEARVVCAKNGREAVELMDVELPSVLVTDLQMPLIDGFGVLMFAARQSVAIPVIVMSAYLTSDIEIRAEAAGAMAMLEKPIDMQQLTALVKQFLNSHSTGYVEGVTLPGFVQLLQIERQNVTLRVEMGNEAGMLHFTDGELTDAWDGTSAGDSAATRIFSWKHVRMDLLTPRISNRATVTLPATHLIMESARLEDEGRTLTHVHGLRRARTSAKEFLATHLAPADALAFADSRASVRLSERPRVPLPTTKTITPSAPKTHSPAHSQPTEPKKEIDMSTTIQTALENVMKIDGAIGTCLCDWTSGLTLGHLGGQGRINIELAGSLNCQVVRAKMEAMAGLGVKGGIEDMLITLDDQYHLIRPLKKAPTIFLYVALDRSKGNLGLARLRLQQIEATMEV